jgi:exopolyphosphatase/guanosine-5'-triphosphate,3'-diphosphate pyrophosphatase
VTRVGVVDLGTNSTRLLVADVADGRVVELHRETRITRLGEGVDAGRRLLPAAVARVHACLADYRRTLDEVGAERTLAIATSAVRDAENGAAFLAELGSRYGLGTCLLSGDEEARLARRGVGSGRELEPRTLIVDVGGGSTELVLDELHTSLDVGSVRLTERFLHDDPPRRGELAACAAAVRALLPAWSPAAAIGVAGSVTTIAALDLGLEAYDPERVHGHVLSVAAVEEQLARLAALTVAQRRALPAMEPERAPVIVGGAIVLAEVVRRYTLAAVEVSERDLLDGAALLAAEITVSR